MTDASAGAGKNALTTTSHSIATDAGDRAEDFAPADLAALLRAFDELEHSSWAIRLTALLGRQVETLGKLIPAPLTQAVDKTAELALKAALRVALRSLGTRPPRNSQRLHRALAAASGAAGGAFGLTGLSIELPVSTTIMLRSIADIARSEGEALDTPEAALSCLEVFALGAREPDNELRESGYFAARALLAQSVGEAGRYLAGRRLTDEAAPALVRLLSQIAGRFGIIVSEKLAAQSLPILGAAGGAAINYAFVGHFQAIAHGHFTIRRLERLYGPARVRQEYERLRQSRDRH